MASWSVLDKYWVASLIHPCTVIQNILYWTTSGNVFPCWLSRDSNLAFTVHKKFKNSPDTKLVTDCHTTRVNPMKYPRFTNEFYHVEFMAISLCFHWLIPMKTFHAPWNAVIQLSMKSQWKHVRKTWKIREMSMKNTWNLAYYKMFMNILCSSCKAYGCCTPHVV